VANSPEKETDPKDEILRIARERFALAEDAERDIRKEALDDLEFRAGKQWPEAVIKERQQHGRPCLTINRVPQFIRQITNDQRQNRPSIKVSPVDDFADKDIANIRQGIIRHIERNSNADVAYDTAFQSAAIGGFGYWRVITEFCDPYSFDLDIKIKRIVNPFSVYLDPHHKEPDGSDTNWGFIHEDLSYDDYKVEYPNSQLAQKQDWSSIGDQAPGWIKEDKTIRVVEYFYKENKEVEIVQLLDGQIVDKSELPQGFPENNIVRSRKSKIPVVKWCKLNGLEVLEETIWPGQWIPIIPVYGDELNVNGKKILEGVVRHAKDSQRMYNFFVSSETEAIALAPKAPYVAAIGQIPKEYEHAWATANQKPHSVLYYDPKSAGGQLLPPPQRNTVEPAVAAITNARLQASDDMKATTGIYDAALGNKSNENSGIAIQRRNQQSQTSNFHLIDNLSRSVKHTGIIVNDLIPHIYDTARIERIIGEEGNEEIVKLNQPFEDKGETKIYDMNIGKYDVSVETGPSFATKRQEAVASMLDLSRAAPQIAAVAADLMVKNMDWPGASEIAERLKKTLPPGIADDKEQKSIPSEIQAQMQQQMQMIEQMTAQLNEQAQEIKTKKYEIEAKKEIEMLKIERDYKLEIIKLQGQASNRMLEAEIAEINQLQANSRAAQAEQNNQNLNTQMPDQQMSEMQSQQPTDGYSSGNFME